MRNHKLSLLTDRRPRGIDFADFRVLGPGLIGLLDLKLGGCNTSLKCRCRFWRHIPTPTAVRAPNHTLRAWFGMFLGV